MVPENLQISLVTRTRQPKEDTPDSDDYYTPLLNTTRTEENKRTPAHYYDMPKLPSVSPVVDFARLKESNDDNVLLKEYTPLDKSYHLNALDDIEYYNAVSDEEEEEENNDYKTSFSELETIVDLSKKYKETGCDIQHRRSSNDYVAIWNCQSGRVVLNEQEYKPLKLECIKESQSVTISHEVDAALKVESPPPSGTRNASNDYDVAELGNESNNANKKYLKNRYGLRSRNQEDEADDSGDERYE